MHSETTPLRNTSIVAHSSAQGYGESTRRQRTHPGRRRHARRVATSLFAVVAMQFAFAPSGSAESRSRDSVPSLCEPGDGTYVSGCQLIPGRADGWYVVANPLEGSAINTGRVPNNAK